MMSLPKRVVSDMPSVRWLSPDRTGHAVPAAAAATELGTADRDHLDSGLPQERVRVHIAVIGDDDAGLDRYDVVAVVPLLAFGLVNIASGLDNTKLVQAEGVPEDIQ